MNVTQTTDQQRFMRFSNLGFNENIYNVCHGYFNQVQLIELQETITAQTPAMVSE